MTENTSRIVRTAVAALCIMWGASMVLGSQPLEARAYFGNCTTNPEICNDWAGGACENGCDPQRSIVCCQ